MDGKGVPIVVSGVEPMMTANLLAAAGGEIPRKQGAAEPTK
jgi:hypothetical protein